MKLGIIGGSGIYQLEGLTHIEALKVETPFGAPSDELVRGELGRREVVFLPRHGKGHRLLPAEINHRANIFAFKQLGIERIVSVSAVGSLREHLRPRDIVLPSQYYDRTKRSAEQTFFGRGLVAHVAFAEPICSELRAVLFRELQTVLAQRHATKVQVHNGGTYVCMEGPAFSTRAESNSYRQLGGDVIGMTSLPEAKLCREAEICYAAMAMVTDYDCWREGEEHVTVEMIIANLVANSALAKDVLTHLIAKLPETRTCTCGTALKDAILTACNAIPETIKTTLKPIIGKYVD
ncbi:MAG: S-methyl-5'-thioadenosine phosphorylase [Verrucomicrobia bacterium]|nr:MAG: S-methyl-5'-thioadenosine phosphorylase [Verrucomicrobiota bacterium]